MELRPGRQTNRQPTIGSSGVIKLVHFEREESSVTWSDKERNERSWMDGGTFKTLALHLLYCCCCRRRRCRQTCRSQGMDPQRFHFVLCLPTLHGGTRAHTHTHIHIHVQRDLYILSPFIYFSLDGEWVSEWVRRQKDRWRRKFLWLADDFLAYFSADRVLLLNWTELLLLTDWLTILM